MEQHNRIFGLDLFRAAAIFMVVIANSLYLFQMQITSIGQFAAITGFLGLEMFFVLSGYMLGKYFYPVFMEPGFGWKNAGGFLKRKLLPIFILYLLVVIMNYIIAWFADYPVNDGWKYFLLIQNFSKPIPMFFPESWGLPVIIFGVLMFVLLLSGLSKIISQKQKQAVFPIATIGLILVFIWTKWLYNDTTANTNVNQWEVSLRTVAIYRFDSVFIGVLISWLFHPDGTFCKKAKWVLALVGCGIVGFFIVGVGYLQLLIETHKVFWNIFYLPLASIGLGCFLPLLSQWESAAVFLQKPIRFLSRISYSVFLLHFSVLLLTEEFLFNLNSSGTKLVVLSLIYVLFAFLSGTILYYLAEKPMRKRFGQLI
ncbi:MAG TPA: acyltransferase [Flavobacterium sp.]|nr:acyltransferase [Flavobacterium sp.]